MTLPLILACLWVLAATLIALAPRGLHWPGAWALIAVGVPILGWVTLTHGPWVGLAVLAAGVSILRWPVIFLARRLLGHRLLGRRPVAQHEDEVAK
ncbi:DUF2484 family protein [Phaeovulum sp. W22_SRMD_FR3]|jgi:hypothetical protein|uniref:DUF2484 family protein n=1 Tax=Phaeovulum sp. W22_SRMD_FR3 TaxID=3240274 RepID=UPI003F9BB987